MLVLLVPLAVCTLMGLFNGVMIANVGMQPIIATLILMVAGRGVAQILTNGKQFTTLYTPFRFIGQGSLFCLPMPHRDIRHCGGRRSAVHAENRVRHHGGIRGHQPQRQPSVRH